MTPTSVRSDTTTPQHSRASPQGGHQPLTGRPSAFAHHYDRLKEHAPMVEKNAQGIPQVDVKVKIRAGCELDGKTEEHTHPQQEWRAMIDAKDGR